jgi:hypothetical protein
MTATIQVAPRPPEVLLPSGFCSANVSVPQGSCYATIWADTLLAFCPSRADHHSPLCCTGESAQPRASPKLPTSPQISLLLFHPHLTKSAQGELTVQAYQIQGINRRMARRYSFHSITNPHGILHLAIPCALSTYVNNAWFGWVPSLIHASQSLTASTHESDSTWSLDAHRQTKSPRRRCRETCDDATTERTTS